MDKKSSLQIKFSIRNLSEVIAGLAMAYGYGRSLYYMSFLVELESQWYEFFPLEYFAERFPYDAIAIVALSRTFSSLPLLIAFGVSTIVLVRLRSVWAFCVGVGSPVSALVLACREMVGYPALAFSGNILVVVLSWVIVVIGCHKGRRCKVFADNPSRYRRLWGTTMLAIAIFLAISSYFWGELYVSRYYQKIGCQLESELIEWQYDN